MRHVGILTGGGDAPGLNAVIRAVVKYGVGQKGWLLSGVEDAFDGLVSDPLRVRRLVPRNCGGLLQRGGTVLGTTNRGDPFRWKDGHDHGRDVRRNLERLGIDGLIVVGGDGTMRIADRLMREHGVPVVGVPKTIDNDLGATDLTFGFQSAVDCVADALDRLHTTAESHDRCIVVEVMGRDAGFIALHGGIAGGADIILLPELPWDIARIAHKLDQRKRLGRPFSLVVVAESARPIGTAEAQGRAAELVVEAIKGAMPEIDVRTTVLGHLQRGGSPDAFDRVLATRFGVCAVDLVEAGRWGELVALRDSRVVGVPLAEAVRANRTVDPAGELVRVARAVGVELGA
ncbi:MAG: ATP-dependent 6-phosphofructokinase [Deltaproteobacteria bacterium]|nr:ATP-dependent 6-phosphofructokinase [Deltaproteobacteria bacterium]